MKNFISQHKKSVNKTSIQLQTPKNATKNFLVVHVLTKTNGVNTPAGLSYLNSWEKAFPPVFILLCSIFQVFLSNLSCAVLSPDSQHFEKCFSLFRFKLCFTDVFYSTFVQVALLCFVIEHIILHMIKKNCSLAKVVNNAE